MLIIANACWALSYLTDGSNEKIQVIIEAGTLRLIMKYLEVEDSAILIPALRVVGNVVSGNDMQVGFFFKLHLHVHFYLLFCLDKTCVRSWCT